MFFGHYSIAMDNKGRVIVPLEFREQIGEKAVIVNGVDKCLWMFTVADWEETAKRIMAIPDMNNPKAREAKRFLFANTCYCDIDKQGRVLIQKRQREYACIEGSVEFIGMGGKLEIWSESRYREPGEEQNMSDVFSTLDFNI